MEIMFMKAYDTFMILGIFCFQVLFRENSGTLRIERWPSFATSW